MREGNRSSQESITEQSWFFAAMLGVLVLLGVVIWYIASHPQQVARLVNPERKTRTVEKPVAKPLVRPSK